MARKPTARTGPAKDAARPKTGEIDEGGELVRDEIKIVKDEPEKITVVHEDDPPATPRQTPREREEDQDLSKRLEAMERDLAAERRARADADARAQQAEERVTKETTRAGANEDAAFRNHKTAIENAATAATGALQAAKRAFVQAQEAGDFTAAADAQEAIADAKGRLLGLEGEQARIKAWEERPKQEPQPETRRTGAATPRDAVDVRAMPRKARDYLEDHPEFLDDWKLWNKLTRAHQDAIDDEVDPYSEEYFERYINPRMGTGGEEAPRRVSPTRQGDGAMPPSRSGPSQGTRNSSEVRLTAREREIAKISWPELSQDDAEIEYARNKRALEAEDRLGTKH